MKRHQSRQVNVVKDCRDPKNKIRAKTTIIPIKENCWIQFGFGIWFGLVWFGLAWLRLRMVSLGRSETELGSGLCQKKWTEKQWRKERTLMSPEKGSG